jgi:hypothetical protein
MIPSQPSTQACLKMTSVARVMLFEGDAFMRFAEMRLRSYWHEPRVLAVELEQVGRVEHCGGVADSRRSFLSSRDEFVRGSGGCPLSRAL